MALIRGRGLGAIKQPDEDTKYALGRIPGATYVSRTYPMNLPTSRDFGCNARCIWLVFDEPDEPDGLDPFEDIDRTEYTLETSARRQIKIEITRDAGNVRQIELQKVRTDGGQPKLQTVYKLDRSASAHLIDVLRALEHIPVEGGEPTVRVESGLMRKLFADAEAVASIYERSRGRFRTLMQQDPSATDVVALAHRREVVEHFRRLLDEPKFFEEVRQATPGKGKEKVWQLFLEANPWILGIGLAGQLLTSWDESKLEQTVAGFTAAGPGSRPDALLRTSGSIRSLVYAEIKHHETDLLCESEYRTGCWAPSEEFAGGVTQVQQTLTRAQRDIGGTLRDRGPDRSYTGEETYMLRPRSFLILGKLDQLRGPSGVHPEKFSSFELYRRNLYEPEVLTFDELLARAEWHVELAETEQSP